MRKALAARSDATAAEVAERPAEDTLRSVERAFGMVERLSDAADGVSLADLARDFGINKAIAQRLLDTMEALGLVWRDNTRQRWHLTYKISNLGLRQLQKGGLLDQCAAILKMLANETGELVRLAVLENEERLTWVYAIAGVRRSVQIDPNYSLDIRFNTHAIAKAWLATLPFEQAWRLMKQQGLHTPTVFSRTKADDLHEDLAATAQRGYAISYQEQELGVGAIAAAIVVPTLDGEKRCVGAVSLAAPTSRMDQAALEACAPLLIDSVQRLADGWPLEGGLPRQRARDGFNYSS